MDIDDDKARCFVQPVFSGSKLYRHGVGEFFRPLFLSLPHVAPALGIYGKGDIIDTKHGGRRREAVRGRPRGGLVEANERNGCSEMALQKEIAKDANAKGVTVQDVTVQDVTLQDVTLKDERFEKVIALGEELSSTQDVDLLLERILTVARDITGADAGSIYTTEAGQLKFSTAQNATLEKKLAAGKKLIYSTFTVPIDDRSIAGYVAASGEALNIPDVYHISGDMPFTFDSNYDDMARYRSKSMLTLPLKTYRGDVVGVLQLINRTENTKVVPFPDSDVPLIKFFAGSAAIAVERAKLTKTIILRMIKMAELRDPSETGPHVNRVSSYAAELYDAYARKKSMPEDELQREKDILKMAAVLHDVGKIAIPDAILKKPGRLTPEERAVMEQHTYLGAKLFTEIYSDFDEAARQVALSHHERWDGGGYPGHIDFDTGEPLEGYEDEDKASGARGKKGEEINLFGRVVAITDVYDALRSNRSYKHAWDESRILEVIEEEAGKQFDPELVEVFLSIMDRIHAISERYPDA